MALNVPAALLPGLAALPGAFGALGAAPRQDGRAFSDLLRQKQSSPPAPPRPSTAPPPASPVPPAAAKPPAKEPERSAEPSTGGAEGAAAEAAPAAKDAAGTAKRDTPPGEVDPDSVGATATLGDATAAEAVAEDDPLAAAQTPADAGAAAAARRGKGVRLPGDETAKAASGLKAGALLRGAPAPGEVPFGEREPGDAVALEAADAESLASIDPGLAQFVAELHLGERPEPVTSGASGTSEAHGASTLEAAASRMLAAQAAGEAAADEALRADSHEALAQAAASASNARLPEQRQRDHLDAMQTARAVDVIGARHDAGREALPIPTAFLSGPAGAAPGATFAAGAAAATAAPHGVPDFAHTLGAQISVLAREGVQRARLNLHGGDMGAVSVQIVMDGTQARVDFGADAAATRDAIAAGLPDLASALREAGLTLSGGDVSPRHSRGGGSGSGGEASAPGASGARAPTSDAVAEAAQRVPLRRFGSAAGGVDLYA